MDFDAGRAHDDSYYVAKDFLAATYKLWEGSWAQDAVKRDRTSGVFTAPAKVRTVQHDGPHYRVHGTHLSAPSPQ
ncbi:hypothetical protein AB7714_12835 [Tardiphaga sp. 1201_B9_N1_1]|jgi:alkanesulfonate monooxygenase SsuD/methylene tetrahydromethanopterin reductase-like flavin-dependent oxidoreductase (luciferase family)|uniref:hypothetical protein n=1 Tax=unclassified Tardiphaga TaxID=2631404 RepID=UPI003F20B166